MGAFVADACGAFAEFKDYELPDNELDICMTMPGGGPFNLDPGQITHDSELTLCLMRGIVDGGSSGALDVERIAL